jgi:drug/metabolite transporter superfamily protein YnfA
MGSFLKELWAFMRERKKFWLLPIILVLVLFGALLVLTEGSAVAPFIYTLF